MVFLVDAIVIGGPGLVGGALLHSLAKRGDSALGTYHSRPAPQQVPLDVTEFSPVRELITRSEPKVIYLTAALTAVDYCELHEAEARRINVDGARNVARAAKDVGAKLVFYSTEYVFDGSQGPYSEEDPLCPQGAYARSKADGERAVLDTAPESLVLRTTVVFGWDRGSKNFAMQVCERLSSGEKMRVPSDQIGNPTLVQFLAQCSVDLVARGASGVVNVVGKDRVPRTDFAIRLARHLGLDPTLIEPVTTDQLTQVAPRPLSCGLTTHKLARLLGIDVITLDDAIQRFSERRASDLP